MRPILLILTLLAGLASAGKPRVLILGDSISIGYTSPVQKLMADEAVVLRPMRNEKSAENCQYTAYGLKNLDRWLGDQKWDLILFNFGLHDLKYIAQELPNSTIIRKTGEAILETPNAHQLAPVEEYAANLETIVLRLKKTNATLIFCTTTPVPEGAIGRFPEDAIRYNKAALAVMEKHKVGINDLHRCASKRLAEIQQPKDVHFTKEGSALLAAEVVTKLRAALASEASQPTSRIDPRPAPPHRVLLMAASRRFASPGNATAPRRRSDRGTVIPPQKVMADL